MGFTAKRYRCVCSEGFKGEKCDEGMTRQVDFVLLYVSIYLSAHCLTHNRAIPPLYLNMVKVQGFRVAILDYSPYANYYVAQAYR